MSRLSIIDEPEDAGLPLVVGIPDGLAGLILAALSGSLATIAGTAVLFWLGWI
jgi:hypothetical protein